MDTEVGHQAAAVMPEPAVGPDEAILVERNIRRRAEIHVPVHAFRRVGIGAAANAVGKHVRVIPDPHEMYAAQLAALDDARHLGVMWGGTLLSAHLNDSVMATR